MKARHTAVKQHAPASSARAIGLRYVNDAEPGIRRVKSGQGFSYMDSRNKPVRNGETLQRIRSLAIPPAWIDVWICPQSLGHLQATGRDARGRKQHRYHPLWREVRDSTKYDRMIAFGKVLPRIRKAVARDLKKKGLFRESVLATVVRLMDLTFIRVGNEEYAKANNSYGLTTLKDRHVMVSGSRVRFSFRGKSGKSHDIALQDKRLARIVRNCQDIPGQDLFQYYDADGARRDVTSSDVNSYLREVSGSDFTAKDFRTWAGTVLAAEALQQCGRFETQRQAKRKITKAITAVAEKLGNTPAVCRKCYIHPVLLDGYANGKLRCDGALTANGEVVLTNRARPLHDLARHERFVLRFLESCRRESEREAGRNRPRLAKLPGAWRPRVPAVKSGRR